MPVLETETLTVSIDAPFETVADDLSDPMTHPEWAVEFFQGQAERREDGEVIANVPMMGGPVRVKVNAVSEQGVIDIFLAPGEESYGSPLPVRLLRNGTGVDVLWTLTRSPNMPAQAWEAGLNSMRTELQSLKARHESTTIKAG